MNSFWGYILQLNWERFFLRIYNSNIFFFNKVLLKSLGVDFNKKPIFSFANIWKKRRRFYRYSKKPIKQVFSLKFFFHSFLKFFKRSFFFYLIFNKIKNFCSRSLYRQFKTDFINPSRLFYRRCLQIYKSVWRDGFIYVRGLIIIFFVDACFTDDEPLWEPIEWSLVLTWILFIFIFAWIAENLITSRYGSYTGRDKRVWFGWYKTFWFLEAWFAISYGAAAMFVIVPFYSELVYPISFSVSWWNWYTRVFFFKFISLYSIVLLIAYSVQINLKWINWKKVMFFVGIINIFISYLLYSHVTMLLFGYFTDPLWYQKTKYIDYINLSHEPWKWGWGPVKRDHFSYHKVSTVFWFKNDGPYAGAFLLIHMFFFISLFLLYIYWLALLRRIYTTKEVTTTFFVFCVSALKQFFYLFFMFYILVLISFLGNYWRFPIEFLWLNNTAVIGAHFYDVFKDYYLFLLSIFFNVLCYLLKLLKFYLFPLFLCL